MVIDFRESPQLFFKSDKLYDITIPDKSSFLDLINEAT
jgi:hypothetical protein